jgi:flagellin
MRVNFNYEASSTHTAYLVNQREMGKSLLRLSTGMRILEASDDAAGLFIADQLSVGCHRSARGQQKHIHGYIRPKDRRKCVRTDL